MREFTLPTSDAIRRAANAGAAARNYYFMAETPAELADLARTRFADSTSLNDDGHGFYGPDSAAEAFRKSREGDLAGVAKSDRLLSKFEALAFETSRHVVIDDVCGAYPNVPAFIAGHPLSMRRRERRQDEAAPLAIIVDLATSGTITADQIQTRGATILALVRALSAKRPVELWAGCLMNADTGTHCVATFARIETAPLDLATAAYVLTSASFPRRICYAIKRKHTNSIGNWPFGRLVVNQQQLAEIVAPAFTHVTQTLCLPPMRSTTLAVTDPARWIAETIDSLKAINLDEAA